MMMGTTGMGMGSGCRQGLSTDTGTAAVYSRSSALRQPTATP
jgi:hypothetical protein